MPSPASPERSTAQSLHARWIVVDPDVVLQDAVLELRAGRVVRVLRGTAARRARGAARALHVDGVVTAGLVNAHAHLELGWAARALRPGLSMARWIEQLLALRRAQRPEQLARLQSDALRAGARALLESGCTQVGDIQVDPGSHAALAATGLQGVAFLELLDAGRTERTAEALRSARARLRLATRAGPRVGLSPHAPYTTSPELLRGIGALARRRPRLPLAVHWAEFAAENAWLEHGRGPLKRLLTASPRCSGLDLLEAVGLLRTGTLLVHANEARAAERERVAASGACVVHCPGAHRWFRRAPFDLRAWLRAGVPVALGTDSLAGNEGLDMRRELALLRASHPWLAPAQAWRSATVEGARALGGDELGGTLRPGAVAAWVGFRVAAQRASEVLEVLTTGCPDLLDPPRVSRPRAARG
ncbi:MAG: amidohydrolase family protein [Planctomycetes bacterium]|nr:amidohydrolase family protein [Planctomycetota bacterium]